MRGETKPRFWRGSGETLASPNQPEMRYAMRTVTQFHDLSDVMMTPKHHHVRLYP